MKIYSNEKLIKRNGKIGNITSIASIVILGVGMFFSFKDNDGSYITFTFTALIVGFILFQIGNYFVTKWGKSPRPDEKISQALKGLDNNYSLYHYQTDVSHLLVCPSGIFALLPYNQPGIITYDVEHDKWKQKGGNFFLKTFGGESLGRPNSEAKYTLADLQKFIKKNEIIIGDCKPSVILVFTNEKASLECENSPIEAVTSDKLKEHIRKKAKINQLSLETIKTIQDKIKVN